MIPGRYDFSIYKGGTLKHKITAVDSDGLSIDFSAYTSMRMQIRPLITLNSDGSVPDPLVTLTDSNAGLTTADAGLTLYINMSAADTAAIDFDMAKYDLELVKAGTPEIVDKLLYGKVTVIPEVTI